MTERDDFLARVQTSLYGRRSGRSVRSRWSDGTAFTAETSRTFGIVVGLRRCHAQGAVSVVGAFRLRRVLMVGPPVSVRSPVG